MEKFLHGIITKGMLRKMPKSRPRFLDLFSEKLNLE